MKYELTYRAPLAESAYRLEEAAGELEAVLAQIKPVVAQLTAGNEAQELTEFTSIYDGSAEKQLQGMSAALRHWSTRLSAIYSAYYDAQCESIQKALNAKNKIV